MDKLVKPKKSCDMCLGCQNNFYNGNNDYGIKQCWSYKSARVKKKLVIGVDQVPPYNETQINYQLSCYNESRRVGIENYAKIKYGPYKGMYCIKGDESHWNNKIKDNN